MGLSRYECWTNLSVLPASHEALYSGFDSLNQPEIEQTWVSHLSYCKGKREHVRWGTKPLTNRIQVWKMLLPITFVHDGKEE
eukprot:5372726-Amphidinium_carterae.1